MKILRDYINMTRKKTIRRNAKIRYNLDSECKGNIFFLTENRKSYFYLP